MLLLKILAMVVFGSVSILENINQALFMIGTRNMLKKSGLPGWQAFIPCYNMYALARTADREVEGSVIMTVEIIARLLGIWNLFIPESQNLYVIQSGLTVMLGIIAIIYYIRLYNGLCEMYSRKKGWIFLWGAMTSVPALVWGFSSKFQPNWKVPDMEDEDTNFFSGVKAEVLNNGLTVNLEERSVKESFVKKVLLRDIHMYIKPGSMVLLLGGSGAGKTTLLNAINGYEKAKAEVIMNGQNMYKEYSHMQYEIGFVPQQDLMRSNDTVLHTLQDASKLRLPVSFTAAKRDARVNEVMKTFGLLPLQDTMVDKLSGGQRKRLSIAMEFIPNPTLFILDEPDSGLDGVMARSLMKELRTIADQGKIVIVITHTPDRVIDLFDDVIVLAKDSHRTGRLAYYGPIDEARAFFGKDTMESIVRSINSEAEGGEGRADEFVKKYSEVQHG